MRILVTSNDPVVQHEQSSLLLKQFPFVITRQAATEQELAALARNENWDLIIIWNDVFDAGWLDILRSLHTGFPRLPILIISKQQEWEAVDTLVQTGIAGYVDKESSPKEIIKAIRITLQGRRYITPYIEKKLSGLKEAKTPTLAHESLSAREFDVFKLLASGKTVSQVSAELKLGITTVSTYRTRLLAKMSMKSNQDLVAYAKKHALI